MKQLLILVAVTCCLAFVAGAVRAGEVPQVSTAQQASDVVKQAYDLFLQAAAVGPDTAKLRQVTALAQAVAAYDPHHSITITVGQVRPRSEPVTAATLLAMAYYGLEENDQCLKWAMVAKPDYEAAIQATYPGLPPGPGPVWAGMVGHCREQLGAAAHNLTALAWVNGRCAWLPPRLAVEDGCSLLAFRTLAEEEGATITWNEATQSATATLGDKSITFTLGSDVAVANGNQVALSVAPYLNQEGSMMVPLRPLVEALGGTVKWAPEPQIVYVTLPEQAASQQGSAESEPTAEQHGG